jgi:hypothetical protein
MATTADMVRVLSSHGPEFVDDEPLLAEMSGSMPKGDAELDPAKMAAASAFPLAPKVVLGLTHRRIAVYKAGWGNKVGSAIGAVPLDRLTDVEIVWNRKLALVAIGLRDAPPVVMRAIDPGSAEHFRNEFLRVRGRI